MRALQASRAAEVSPRWFQLVKPAGDLLAVMKVKVVRLRRPETRLRAFSGRIESADGH
jgi:hypothetical protein